MWIYVSESDVLTRLSGPEAAAMKTAALQTGQANPLPEVITQVVREVRGYVKACARNTLGDGETIPDEILGAAINRIRYDLATRLPVPSLLTEARLEANRAAIALLRDVAACRFTLEQPATASAEISAATSAQVVTKTTRIATRAKLSGL